MFISFGLCRLPTSCGYYASLIINVTPFTYFLYAQNTKCKSYMGLFIRIIIFYTGYLIKNNVQTFSILTKQMIYFKNKTKNYTFIPPLLARTKTFKTQQNRFAGHFWSCFSRLVRWVPFGFDGKESYGDELRKFGREWC